MNDINLILDKAASQAVVPNLASLIWAASAIDSMAQWYLGRCIWRLEITRNKAGEHSYFGMHPMDREDILKPLRWASVTTLKSLVEQKQFPVRLIEPWREGGISNEGTIICIKDMWAGVNIGLVTYQLADIAMDYFKRGATVVRAQYSQELSQIYGDVGLSEREFKEFTNLNVPDYEAHDSVGDLP